LDFGRVAARLLRGGEDIVDMGRSVARGKVAVGLAALRRTCGQPRRRSDEQHGQRGDVDERTVHACLPLRARIPAVPNSKSWVKLVADVQQRDTPSNGKRMTTVRVRLSPCYPFVNLRARFTHEGRDR